MGFGSSVIARLLQTSIKKNLWYTIKDKIVEERFNGPTVHRRTQKTKVYGSDSTKQERDELMEILRDRVEYHKDKIISPTIYQELCGMEVKKSGKIEHSTNTHDDQVFSWLWALYIYYNGGDLMNNWGIERRVLKTDADLEEAVVDLSENDKSITQELDLIEDEEVTEQMQAMQNAPGRMGYEEWMRSESEKDEAAMDKLLANKAVQKSLAERYHVVVPQTNKSIQTIPAEVFLDFNTPEEEIEVRNNAVLVGNMSKYW